MTAQPRIIPKIEKFFMYSFIETIAKVSGQGAASCFSCGFGETCKVGIPCMMYGEGVKITPEMVPDVSKQPNVMQSAIEAGKYLGRRLSENDRKAVTLKMQKRLMDLMKTST